VPRLRHALLAAAAGAALLVPVAPAAAAGPLLPWILGRHLVGAVVGLATLPLAVASALSQDQPVAQNAPPGYGGGGYYPPPNYYAPQYYPPPAYYAPRRDYYRPAVSYAHSPGFYGAPRGYYAPPARYTGGYGAHVPNQSGRSAYRRR
jgi:hypothetical protein